MCELLITLIILSIIMLISGEITDKIAERIERDARKVYQRRKGHHEGV